jgi:L-lactate dehydrogenase complex protein LldG
LGAAQSPDAIAGEYAAIERTYTRAGVADRDAVLALFAERLHEYDARVYAATPGTIASVVAEILTVRGKTSLVIPDDLPGDWQPQGYVFSKANDWDAYRLDSSEGVLSGCTVAIAETGSIVLQNAVAQGPRILSLVPDYHLCVVFARQVVATVPEAFAQLETTSTLPTTFISGPSATADIEMTRIKGVHGPRFLDVIIVGD